MGFGFAAGYVVLVVAVFALTAATTTPSNVGLDWLPFYLLTMPWSPLIDPDVPWAQPVALIAFLAGMVVNTAAIYIIGSQVQALGRSGILACPLMLLASAVAWWPTLTLDVLVWIPFGCVALCMCLLMALVPSGWPLLTLASGIGTFGGLLFGSVMWPPADPIAGGYVPIVAAVLALLMMLIGCLAGVILRRRLISNTTWRRTAWVAILASVAFGLVSLAFEFILIQRRIDRNEQLAEERLTALKDAMDRAVEAHGVSSIRAGALLDPHYFGPPFRDMNWEGAVTQDGYRFFIGARSGGYAISAVPVRKRLDGTRQFCTDELGTMGCHVEWNGSRTACLPCSK